MIDVLYLNVTNINWFQLSLQTLEQNLLNYNKIFVLKSNLDLSQFKNIIVLNKNLFQFLSNQNITQNILIIEENMGFLSKIDINHIPITHEINNKKYNYDHIKPQLINKNNFSDTFQCQYPLTQYYKNIERMGIPNSSFTIFINKPICCTTKSLLKIKSYVMWNTKGFESLKKYLNKYRQIQL